MGLRAYSRLSAICDWKTAHFVLVTDFFVKILVIKLNLKNRIESIEGTTIYELNTMIPNNS